MKRLYIIAIMSVLAAGCSKFLDVNPKGEVFDADMFTTAEGFEDALYGVYNELAGTEALYGGYFHWIPEVCSQNVTASSDYKLGNLGAGDWYTAGPTTQRSAIWKAAYLCINHINNIVAHCDDETASSLKYIDLYKGEAIALRALVHFELLRLFAVPLWADAAERAKGIPYVSAYSFDVTPYSSVDEAYSKVVEELKVSEALLAEDEILVPAERTNVASGFTAARITHINLYAVQALLARVYWTMGDLENAAVYASKVIDSGKFTFRSVGDFVQPDNGTLDMHETIFGLYSTAYQNYNKNKYALGSSSTSSSFTLASDWKSLYDGLSATRTDYRLGAWFSESEGKLLKLVNRIFYAESSSSYGGSAILGCNILRIPEMYYIMAEYWLGSDNTKAVEYYDAVALSRGDDSLAEMGAPLTRDGLFAERRREFYGEGFTWHEMRLLQMDVTTFSGDVLPGNLTSTWTLPIPEEEDEARNNVE